MDGQHVHAEGRFQRGEFEKFVSFDKSLVKKAGLLTRIKVEIPN
jgi:hypothetical protein